MVGVFGEDDNRNIESLEKDALHDAHLLRAFPKIFLGDTDSIRS